MKRPAAFTLAELLVAMALALVVATIVVRGLLATGRSGERLALLLRERTMQRRTLALLRAELAAARSWQQGSGTGAACNLGGRTAVVQLAVEGRTITYSVGSGPSPIWRGRVLMRCGPAYGLEGELSSGTAQNRVILDGLAPGGLKVEEERPGVLRLQLRQEFSLRGGGVLGVSQEMRASAPAS